MDYPVWKNTNYAFFESHVFTVKKGLFSNESQQILFFGAFAIKQKVNYISNFSPKLWTNPFRKMRIFVRFGKRCFHSPEMLVCYIKRRKSFFHDLFSRSIPWGYWVTQKVTRGYMGLQGVTRYYRNVFCS